MKESNFLIERAKTKKKNFIFFILFLAIEFFVVYSTFFYLQNQIKNRILKTQLEYQLKKSIKLENNQPIEESKPTRDFLILLKSISDYLSDKIWLSAIQIKNGDVKIVGHFENFVDVLGFSVLIKDKIDSYKVTKLRSQKNNQFLLTMRKR